MKSPPVFRIASLCAAGLASGYIGHRLMTGKPETDETASSLFSDKAAVHARANPAVSMAPAKLAEPVSTDTLESITEIEDEPSFQRLAAWLMRASEPEIAAYWRFYRQKKRKTHETCDLIFIHWTRLDPQAAIAASADTPDEHRAWWAWACHDPQRAFATAVSTRPEQIKNVARGLGEFHPIWMMEHFQEIPEEARDNAIWGMTSRDVSADPGRILDFLQEHGGRFDQGIFKSLVRNDPWAAYEWVKANAGVSNEATRLLAETMKDAPPERLEQFASRLPSGEMKRKVEAIVFEALVASDPDQALAQANATKSSTVAVQRYATLALAFSKTDPARAMEVTRKMFETDPRVLNPETRVEGPVGTSWGGTPDPVISQVIDRMMSMDPAGLLEIQPVSPHDGTISSFQLIAHKWAARDFPAFADWADRQTVPEVRDEAAELVIHRLSAEAHYEEAVRWAMSSQKLRTDSLLPTMAGWIRAEPERAKEWLKSAPLTENERAHFQMFQSSPSSQPGGPTL